MTVTITIPGKPYGKKRPRFSRKSGRAYDPKENASYEAAVAAIALPHFPVPLTGPVSIRITAIFAPPQSWSRKKADAALGNPHVQKPDVDNLAKAICDGLNRIAWGDDAQIAGMTVSKAWGATDQVVVSVNDWSAVDAL